MIITLLKVMIVIVLAFAVFTMGLVVAFIGFVYPGTTPMTELRKLAGYVDHAYSAVRRVLDTPID